jgi:hypothetical protein
MGAPTKISVGCSPLVKKKDANSVAMDAENHAAGDAPAVRANDMEGGLAQEHSAGAGDLLNSTSHWAQSSADVSFSASLTS